MPRRQEQNAKNQSEKIGDYVSIYRRGSNWHANFMENGKQRRLSLGTTNKKQARLNAMKIENRLLAGEQESPKGVKAKELIQRYRDHVEGGSLARKTKQKYVRVLDFIGRMVSPGTDATELNYSFLDRFRAKRLKQVAESTTHDECVIIQQMTKFGGLRRLLAHNPLAGYRLPKPKPQSQPCWTREEGARIVDAVPEAYQTAFRVLLDTGMRSGELTHLQWKDVDFDANVIHIRQKSWKSGGEQHLWLPKTGDQRAIPMSNHVRGGLLQLSRKTEWVFLAPPSHKYPDGTHRVTESRLLKVLKPVLRQLGLEGKVHTFRHTFISHALTSGVPEATVRSWVGHVDDEIIRRYTHIADQISQQQMSLLANRS